MDLQLLGGLQDELAVPDPAFPTMTLLNLMNGERPPRPTAVTPVDTPYCSYKLTKERLRAESRSTPLGALIDLLIRLDDLSHCLIWTASPVKRPADFCR